MNRATVWLIPLFALGVQACNDPPDTQNQIRTDKTPTFASSCPPVSWPIENAVFFGPAYAWIVTGEKDLLLTRDGGKTWDETSAESIGGFECVSFIDTKQGWAINDRGLVWSTLDGGRSWSLLATIGNGGGFSIDQMKFENQTTGWILEPFSIWRTTDGGVNWIRTDFAGPLADACFLNEQVAWVVDQDERFFETNDGGNTSRLMQTPGRDGEIRSIYCLGESKGWLARSSGQPKSSQTRLYYTDDGAKTWQLRKIPSSRVIIDAVYFRDENEGWVAGSARTDDQDVADEFTGVLMRTQDGGRTWKTQSTGFPDLSYKAVYFADSLNGWLRGYDKIYRTEDGGESWVVALNLKR